LLTSLHEREGAQRFLGFLIGIAFGFLLQKGGVTRYEVIMGQLLLEDFTVAKVMLTAVVTGMVGVHLLRSAGLARLHPKAGSFGSSVVGGLIFGAGFGLLGYCPGTVAGAAGQGSLDALFGGVAGIIIGAGLFAALYPKLEKSVLRRGDFGAVTVPELIGTGPWAVVLPVSAALTLLLVLLEQSGL
jgi:uncharacterized protein